MVRHGRTTWKYSRRGDKEKLSRYWIAENVLLHRDGIFGRRKPEPQNGILRDNARRILLMRRARKTHHNVAMNSLTLLIIGEFRTGIRRYDDSIKVLATIPR